MITRLKVSAVIPAYNSETTIARAIDSVISQTRPADEVIVVDDFSDDATRQIVASYSNRGVTLIPLSERAGAGAARNAGIAAASGDLIAFLDADDEWLVSKLEKQIALISSDDAFSFVACASNMVSPEGVDMGDTFQGQPVVVGADTWKALLARNFVTTPTVLARRNQLIALGGFDAQLKVGEDQDLWIRLALAGSMGYLHTSLARVHIRPNSLSSSSYRDLLIYTLPMIEKHLESLHDKLTDAEIREILGERLRKVGCIVYAQGHVSTGTWLIARSILLGYRPFEGAYYLATAAPPVTWFKRQFGIKTTP